MRLSLIMTFLTVLSASANVNVLSQKVTLNFTETALSEVFYSIRNQTGQRIIYSTDRFRPEETKVTVNMQNVELSDALVELLKGLPYTFTINGQAIVIIPETEIVRQQPQTPAAVLVTGTVTDSHGNAIRGVAVMLKGTTTGTVTDINGNYSIAVRRGDVLRFNFLGMLPREVEYTGQEKIDVRMDDAVTKMEQVVVTGIFNRPKESFTGAVTMVEGRELRLAGTRNILTSLSNLDPSFRIPENNALGSDPNALPYIIIRGETSMEATIRDVRDDTQTMSNLPLFIMDGFEVSLQIINDLDPNLVENIMIFKDANATAMYGSRGANGVVVITMVQPEPGQLRFSYTGNLTFEVPDLSSYNMMNSREKLEYEWAAGLYKANASQYEQQSLEMFNRRWTEMARGVDTYWLKYPVQSAIGNNHTLRIDGGRDEIRYGINLSYRNTKGAIKGSDRDTFTGGSTLQYNVKKVMFKNDLTITYSKGNNSPYGSFSQWGLINSYYSPYDEDGMIKKVLEGLISYHTAFPYEPTSKQQSSRILNPLWDAIQPQINSSHYTNIRNNTSMEWRILDGLIFRGSFGLNAQYDRSDIFQSSTMTMFDSFTGANLGQKGRYTYGSGNSMNYAVRATLDYSKLFGKHQLAAGASFDLSQNKSERYTFIGEGISNPNMDFLGMASQYLQNSSPQGSESLNRSASVAANIVYTYDNRYFINMTSSLNGSSQFGVNRRWAPFASAGIGWNIHNESFMEGDLFSELRLRSSYGITGSQNFSTSQALTTYRDAGTTTYSGWWGANIQAMGNEDLKWQTTYKFNAGLDARVLKGRLGISGNFYHDLTKDLVSDITIPASSGFQNYRANIGEVTNVGFELSVNGFIVRNTDRKMSWNVGASIAHNKNKIRKISNTLKRLNETILSSDGADPSLLYKEGQSMNTLYAVKSLGIDPSNGNEIFVKQDGRLTYTWNSSDKIPVGHNGPRYNGTAFTTFVWRDFEIAAYFAFQFGGQAYNQTLVNKLENIMPYQNADRRAFTDRWQTPGVHAKFKNIQDFSATRSSSRFIQDDDRFTLNSLSIGYQFNSEWLKRNLGVNNLKLTGNTQDVLYISTIKRERGLDYPFSRKFSIGLQSQF